MDKYWIEKSQKVGNKGREALVREFLENFIAELMEGAIHPLTLLKDSDVILSKITDRWVYKEVWKVKGSFLRHFIAQLIKRESTATVESMFKQLEWNLDESLNPEKFTDVDQTVETFEFLGVQYKIAFTCCTRIKFGTRVEKNGVWYTVIFFENGRYILEGDDGEEEFLEEVA